VRLTREKHRVFDHTLVEAGFLLGEDLEVVEAANEQQRGHVLDHFERVADAAGPERVPDAVDLALQFTGDPRRNSN
jgi:hypothetical protein